MLIVQLISNEGVVVREFETEKVEYITDNKIRFMDHTTKDLLDIMVTTLNILIIKRGNDISELNSNPFTIFSVKPSPSRAG